MGFPIVASILNYTVRVAQRLCELHERNAFDVVEAPEYFAEGLALNGALSLPLVVRLHLSLREILAASGEKPSLDQKLACWLEKLVVRKATKIAANSKFSANLAPVLYGIPSDRVMIAPHGIDLQPDDSESNNGAMDTARQIVLFAGRLSQRKGSKMLIDAIPGVVDRVPSAQFVIVGADRPSAPGGRTYQKYFNESVANSQCSRSVIWRGFLNSGDLQHLYKQCDVFVSTSLYETFGFTHLEAMSHGKPVVACRASATPEIVVNGVTGFLVEPENSRELGDAIVRLLSDCDLKRKMGRAALSRAQEFSVESMVENTAAIYLRAIADAKSRQARV